jgi:amidase
MSRGTLARWAAAAGQDLDAVPPSRRGDVQPRTVRHAALGRRLRPQVRAEDVGTWQAAAERFLAGRDLLLTPPVATAPPAAAAWSRRSWTANVVSSLRWTGGFAAPWNLAGWPALSLPAGHDAAAGVPLGVQLVARPGDESLLLAVAALIEARQPWPRVATTKMRR